MTTTLENIRHAAPIEGLFAGKDWLISPEPFPLSEHDVEELEKLGYRLSLFNRAANLLYQLSLKGKRPAWIAGLLDRGKPPELLQIARSRALRDELPRVIRPDIILTERGWAITELDTVPGGIGLTAWLNQTYSRLGRNILGGPDGMIEGFRSLLPKGGTVLVSEESATYRPEMQWVVNQLSAQYGDRWNVADAENFVAGNERSIYRFFELFDLPNIPGSTELLASAAAGDIHLTPPPKPYLEEKMWFALFWLRPLREFWRREIGERHFLKLQQVIPYTWLLDPTPLPPHAVLPGLDVQNWLEITHFSQKQRELVVKISGFSEKAWGSRGVDIAQDLPQNEWTRVVNVALREFETHPHILQRFHKGRLVEHPYFDDTTGETRMMRGRVRLCPYYFHINNKAELRGALATIVPADKKILHGMRDAILCPAGIAAA